MAHVEDLVALLGSLAACDGWGLWERESAAPELQAFELLWRTKVGIWSGALVVGPFPFFPVTRRAPYTAVLLWPTSRANALTTLPPGILGIGDAPPVADDIEGYRKLVKGTRAQVSDMAGAPAAALPKRDVSVYLPRELTAGLRLSALSDDPRPPGA